MYDLPKINDNTSHIGEKVRRISPGLLRRADLY